VGLGPTTYLAVETAEQLAKAIHTCAQDVRVTVFSKSPFSPVEIDDGEQGKVQRAAFERVPVDLDAQDTATGLKLAELLRLKMGSDGRYNTDWGTKTPMGLARCVQRIVQPDNGPM